MIRHIKPLLLLSAITLWFANILPEPLFNAPYSTLVYSAEGHLLSARIATDGQWRSAPADSVPQRFVTCLMQFEDRYFRYHPGVNPVALVRAAWLNIRKGKIVSGGSTITMQVIRLSRGNRSRTIWEKLVEILLATRAEIKYTKDEITQLFAAHAPFGGNTVGLTMASQRYFGRQPHQLSWAESATLAVLPNSPSLIHPGRNRQHLLQKRNRLLILLYKRGYIDADTYQLSLSEPLPNAPYPASDAAPHLLDRIVKQGFGGTSAYTTINSALQDKTRKHLDRRLASLRGNFIFNGAVLIARIETGEVLTYVGNGTPDGSIGEHGHSVDIITSLRSPGSVLKPLLYCAATNSGELLPGMLLPDIPVALGGYSPQNHNNQYDGAVPARMALSRSLNIPAVMLLRDFGTDRFYQLLKKSGITTLTQPASHYGLSLILGGAECTPWDIAGVYASLGRTLGHYTQYQHRYFKSDFRPLTVFPTPEGQADELLKTAPVYSAGAIYSTLAALLEVNKPETETGWEYYLSARKIAWKTGTSFGYRDAWAVGMDTQHVVLVWIGNADGTGRPELSGINSAAPLLFDIFRMLPRDHWYQQPFSDMKKLAVCPQSGYVPGQWCTSTDTVWTVDRALNLPACPYHRQIHLDSEGLYQVSGDCYSPAQMHHRSWFVLPPLMEAYYRRRNADYTPPPPFAQACTGQMAQEISFVYPWDNTSIMVPRTDAGSKDKCVFEVMHRRQDATVYWHIDGSYAGETQNIHQLLVNPPAGNHVVTVTDENGNSASRRFSTVSASKN